MNNVEVIFIGIDITTAKQPFTWAGIDGQLKLSPHGHGNIDEVMAIISNHETALIAITSPSGPNIGLLNNAELLRRLTSQPRKGRRPNQRVAEYEMHLAALPIARTPSQLSKCSKIVQRGFSLYDRLKKIGCYPFPTTGVAYQWMEVSPEAAFKVLFNGQIPLKAKTLEGRLQRQLRLFDLDLSIPDPMFFFEEVTRHRLLQGILPLDRVFSPSELNALVAAYTAWLAVHQPNQVTVFGIAQESLIYTPGNPPAQFNPDRFVSLYFEPAMSSKTGFQDDSYE